MRLIRLNQRSARLLRDNLTGNQEGYDYVDLVRLDRLAKKIADLQGDYGARMAELAREERVARRHLVREPGDAEAQRALQLVALEAEELHEAAAEIPCELLVEDADYKLIRDKLGSVGRWVATDGVRELVIGLVEAVNNAEEAEGSEREPRRLRG